MAVDCVSWTRILVRSVYEKIPFELKKSLYENIPLDLKKKNPTKVRSMYEKLPFNHKKNSNKRFLNGFCYLNIFALSISSLVGWVCLQLCVAPRLCPLLWLYTGQQISTFFLLFQSSMSFLTNFGTLNPNLGSVFIYLIKFCFLPVFNIIRVNLQLKSI